MLQAQTKASWDRQNYCIPAKSFTAGQIDQAAKLPWITSNFITSWPLQLTKIAWSSMHCCVMYQIIRFANQKLIVDGLGYWTAGSYASIIANNTDTTRCQTPRHRNHWTQIKKFGPHQKHYPIGTISVIKAKWSNGPWFVICVDQQIVGCK